MNRKRFGVCVLALGSAAVGCGPRIQAARLSDRLFEPHADGITVYSTKKPECAYEEIAILSGHRRNFWNNMDDVLDAMRKRARELGGDAIVDLSSDTEVTGGTQLYHTVDLHSSVRLKGTVVRFTDRSCRK